MLEKSKLILIAGMKMAEVFGKPYLREHMFNDCCHAQSEWNGYFELFCGFKGDRATNKWLEFAAVRVNIETGEAYFADYRLPDGTRMENPPYPVRCA